ncbi:hypothetical protein B296_00020588 [Ensete ventricosum]|uniref:Uncharacterized protein n=1 Tax=Ensete ventricosum TaxID=4639 RepID=A0A427AHT7_ENSVE|nr:hypothetical protein B296_00020588 [Ensete ventricosum]
MATRQRKLQWTLAGAVVGGLCVAVGGSSGNVAVRDNAATEEGASGWGCRRQIGAAAATTKEEAGVWLERQQRRKQERAAASSVARGEDDDNVGCKRLKGAGEAEEEDSSVD